MNDIEKAEILRNALVAANQGLVALEAEEVTAFPQGKTMSGTDCPMAKLFKRWAWNIGRGVILFNKAENADKVAAAWGEVRGYRYWGEHGVGIPRALRYFTRGYDDGEYPELIQAN